MPSVFRHVVRMGLSLACAVCLVAGFAPSGLAASGQVEALYDPVVTRIQGADRYETASQIAEKGWPDGSEYVVVATGQNFPDALAGAPLAHAYGAPILLTKSASLPASVSLRIDELGAQRAIILGGTAAVSATVENSLKAILGTSNVERISGADRYQTAARVAERVRTVAGLGGKVVIATGTNYPDALAVSGYAAARRYPILLTKPTSLPAYTSGALSSLGATSTIVVGGTSAVSDAVKALLPSPVRIQGANRYATSIAIADAAVADGMSWAELVVATGTNFPDALGAGPLTARFDGVTVLTDSIDLRAEAETCMQAHLADIDEVILVGGPAAISTGTETTIGTLLATAPSEWSSQRQVSSAAYSSTLYGHNVGAAGDSLGNLHVVWQEGGYVLYKKLDRYGNTLVHDAVVTSGLSTTYRSYPSVAPASDRVTVVWRRASGGDTVEGIWAAQLDATGRVLEAPRRLHRVNNRYNEVAVDGSGAVHIVAIERDDPGRPLYARYDPDLDPVISWTPVTVIGGDRMWTRTPEVLGRGDGSVDLAWMDRRDESLTLGAADMASYYDVFFSRLVGSDGEFDDAASVDQLRAGHKDGGFLFDESGSNDSGDAYAPGLAVGADGSTHIAWLDARSDVYYTRIGADGTVAAPQAQVTDRAVTSAAMDPTALCTPRADGGADIVYPDAFLGSGVRLAQVRVDALGAVVGSPERIPGASIAPQRFHVAAGPDGERSMVYIGDGTTDKLYYLDTRRNSAAWDTARSDLTIDDAHTPEQDPALAPKAGQAAHVEMTVFNTGWASSQATTWKASFGGVQFASGALPVIAAGGSTDISFDWTVPAGMSDPEQYVTVTLDPANGVSECSETNNSVAHRVLVWPRPDGAGISVHGVDETEDPTHANDYVHEVPGFSATLSGTASEPSAAPWSKTVNTTSGWAQFGIVPPGTYSLTVSSAGYTSPAPMPVTVTRNVADEYEVTVTPGDSPTAYLNTWGAIECMVLDSQGTPDPGDDEKLNGATVRLHPGDRTASTSADAPAELQQVAEGPYTLDVSAPGFEPVFDHAVQVTRAQTTSPQIALDPTPDAWVDLTVTNQYGSPLSGAMVELRNAAHGILTSGVTSAAGRVRLHADAASVAYVDVNKSLWTEQEWAVSLSAGEVLYDAVEMQPTGGIGYVSSDWGRWILSAMHYDMNGNEWWGFWRNFHNRFDVIYRTEGADTYITQLDSYVRGKVFTWSCSAWQVDIDTPVGNIPELSWQIPVPVVGEPANVLVERIKIVDSWSGEELWSSGIADSWYSHDGIAEENYDVTLVEDGEPGDGVRVPWPTAQVRMWVNVQMAVAGETGSDGWQSMPTGGTGKAIVVWTPSTNQMYVQPWLYDPW